MAKPILKFIVSGFIAFVVCSLFSSLYYNVPLKEINNTGATDYTWEANKFYSRGTEGYALGKTNNEGFNNIYDYTGQEIDLLLMGSSHMEAFNVAQEKTTVARLNQILGQDRFTYNIGISGHTIYTQIANLEDALKTYSPTEYVILETMSLPNNVDKLNEVLNNEVLPVGNRTDGGVRIIESFDYLKLLFTQLQSYINNNLKVSPVSAKTFEESQHTTYIEELDSVLSYLKEICNKNNVTPIILFHPLLSLQKDGSVISGTSVEDLAILKKLCDENDIILVDMTDRFIQEYKKAKNLPHGFSNTKVGVGHLNENGHSMIAEELSHVIK